MHKKTVKGFVLGLSTALVIGSATLTVGAASGAFQDIKAGTWYESAVLWAQEKGIVNGYPDRTFKPNNNVTRAELTGVVQNLAKEGYIDADIPLDGYEMFEAIQVGKTTFRDLEEMFGDYSRGSVNGASYVSAGDILIGVTPGNDNSNTNDNPNANDVVTSKWYDVREPLKKRYPQVTKPNLEKLEDSMSYEMVSAILGGKGLLERDTTSYKAYVWYDMEGKGERLVFNRVGDGLSLDRKLVKPAVTNDK